jgi:peptide/nickel transport system permease protein
MIPQLILISFVTFWLSWIMPGDFVSQRRMAEEHLSWQEVQTMREQLGLDDPWYVQYVRWAGNIITGDLGMSFQHHRPVTSLIRDYMGNTFRLSLTSTLLLFAIAIPLGILAGRYYRKPVDKVIILYGFIGVALPSVVYGILLVWLFSFQVTWFPFRGSIDPMVVGTGFLPELLSRLRHLVLPTVAIATAGGVGIIYFLRAQIVEGRGSDYAITAKAKGVPEKVIFNKHILRNSLVPFAPMFGGMFFTLFTGTVLIERIFAYPGMGQLFFMAIQQRDSNIISGLVLMYSVMAVLGVLLGDIILTIVDPRIRMK